VSDPVGEDTGRNKMYDPSAEKHSVIVLGGGFAGLSAGYVLSKEGRPVKVFESDATVGGLSKTIEKDGFRFDLGGHRFFTKDPKIDSFVRDLMGEELLHVDRSSKIFLRGRYFDYPLKPLNAMFGLGLPTTLRIIADYVRQKIRRGGLRQSVSLEDWVIENFGRTMFDIYFKEYSEKVWGMDCRSISVDWVAKRILGLSLAKAIKNAFFKFSGKDIPSLVDRFVYPRLGIGRISDRLEEEIRKNSEVYTGARVERICHDGNRIEHISVKVDGRSETCGGSEFISSIPITKLVSMFDPPPPDDVLEAAKRLKFRDLVVVAVMIDKRRVTDQTWIYIPEKRIPFGRIHEPTNWSEEMAPEGKTLLVMEYFSFAGDDIWQKDDAGLTEMTLQNLEKLGFANPGEVIDSVVVRVPRAYPLFEVGYADLCRRLYSYLDRFENLQIAGRSGMFRYYNMDHAIESGIDAAEIIIRKAASGGGRVKEMAAAGKEP